MTSLIDDGLAEDCLDNLISSLDCEQNTIINLDDINATIEDPGYILEESLATNNETKEYTSSYRKGSFTLPVTFFDVSNNIHLLQKCRPVSIRVVDCKMYPWCYKEIKPKSIRNSIVYEDDDDEENDGDNKASEQDGISGDYDYTSETYDSCKERLSSPARINDILSRLSPKESITIVKLKEKIEKYIDAEKSNSYTTPSPDIDKQLIENDVSSQNCSVIEPDKVLTENHFDKDLAPNDLSKCKALAQTIVRSIDYRDIYLEKKDAKTVQETEILSNRVCSLNEVMRLANVKENSDIRRKVRMRKSNGKTITSPMLSSKIKARKKTDQNEKLPMKNKKASRSLKVSSNSSRTCKTLISTTNKIIPHYHYGHPMPAYTYNFNNYYLNTDQMKSQYNVTKYTASHYVEQNRMINKYPQHELHNSGREEPKASANSNIYADVMPTMHSNPLSYNTTLISNINKLQDFVTTSNYINPLTQAFHPRPSFDYHDNFNYHVNRGFMSGYSPEIATEHTIYGANARGTDISNDNYRFPAKPPGYSTSLTSSPVSSHNPHFTPTGTQSLNQPTLTSIQYNPLLTQLLNKPSFTTESNQYVPKQIAQTSNFSTVTRHAHCNAHNNTNNVHSTKLPSKPQSSLKRNITNSQLSDAKIAVNITSTVTSRKVDNVHKVTIHRKAKAAEVENVNRSITGSSRPIVRGFDANRSIDLTHDDVSVLEKLLTTGTVTNKHANKPNNVAVTTLLKPINDECKQKNLNSEKAAPNVTDHLPVSSPIPTFEESFEMFLSLKRNNAWNIINGGSL